MMYEEAVEWRVDQHHAEKEPVQKVIDRRQIPMLYLVEHHEPIMLSDDVVIGPHGHNHYEHGHPPQQDQRRSQAEEKGQAAKEQSAMRTPCFAVEIGTRGHREDVGAVE